MEAVGGAVTALKEGDRVAYASAPPGAYAGLRTIAADAVVKLPDAIGFEQAAATMLKGMTAEYLVHKSGKVQPGDTVLVHAAAGGTGLLLCQWLAHRGAIVIGCAGDDNKRRLAEGHGCRHAIDYRREDVAARVADLTGGEGLAVVYDSIGRDTAEASVACLRPGGTLVLYAARRAPSLSMSSRQRRINPSRSCAPASSRRTPHPPRSKRAPVRSSRCWRAARLMPISAGAMRSPMRQRRIATSKRGAPPARAF